MEKLAEKSKQLTAYLEFLINELKNDAIEIITPKDTKQRGAQLSIRIKNSNKNFFHQLTATGVVCDWREPDVIRLAPVPLYNSFLDVYQFVQKLKLVLS